MFKYLKNNRGFTLHTLKKVRGFTLIELLIVIGILAILATTVVMVINPAEMVKQSRDGNRMAELQSINKALLVYQSFGGSSSMGTSNIIYISLPDSDSQCGSYYGTLTATSSPWNYHCSPEADYRKTDGTGWIPVDLTSVESSSGALFASLPIDPNNTATDQHYYTYIPGSWALSTTLESTKYLAANATSDGGQSSTRFEVGNNLSLNNILVLWTCGSSLTYVGQDYATVEIGSQCWMAENLNVGTMIIGTSNQTDNAVIEKYCYSDTESNCTSDGGLYQWNETMQYASSCNGTGEPQPACSNPVQGICPDEWHIPSHYEFTALEREVCDSGSCVTDFPYDESTTNWKGTDEGTQLKVGGSSGFEGLLAGYRHNGGSFYYNRGTHANIWSSFQSDASNAWSRHLYSGYATIYRYALNKLYGYSIRCIKD
jgi:uncharacterized protein (TIGR02145 family)/prepilin-type N-terminal cleavage/methylation domain-containing protein